MAQDGGSVLLHAGKAGGWRFRARGATLRLEPSIYLGRAGEARRSQQMVLSARTEPGQTVVKWALQKDAKEPSGV